MMSKGKFIRENLVVHVPNQMDTLLPLNNLYSGRNIVLKVFRNFGCPFTRCDAQQLSQEKKRLDSFGADLVGIGFDDANLGDFTRRGLWKGKLFIDPERHVYEFFRLQRLSKFKALRCILHKETRDFYHAIKKDLGGCFQGDVFQTGGTFVINSNGRILYACPQPDISVFTNVPAVLKACEKEFNRQQCISYTGNEKNVIHPSGEKNMA